VNDPGLQVERTVLAWRRTAASFVVAAVVAGRLLAGHLGGWAFVAAVVAAVAVLVIAGAAMRRRAPDSAAPRDPATALTSPGRLAAVALATAVAGLSVVTAVLVLT
jgi:uncharacterized membrane protein YidH (DUF202 family)